MTENNIVVKLCGNYPENFIKPDINSNPNYVFENDINYDSIKLFDADENSVFVNSFIECQHYVTGGWDFLPEIRNEEFYLNVFTIFSIISVFSIVILVKYFSSNENK